MNNELLIEEGTVVSSNKGFAEISISKSEMCEDCSARILCKIDKDDLKIIKVIDPVGTSPGDYVKIAITGSSLLKSSFYLYGLPLLILIVSVLLTNLFLKDISNMELFSFLIGIFFVALYYGLGFSLIVSFPKSILPKIISFHRNQDIFS